MGAEREFITTLTLPYESIRTLHEGSSEVRLYRNQLIGERQIGKRYSPLGLESTVAVNEGQLLKRIRHPHVVPVEDVVTPSGYDPILSTVELADTTAPGSAQRPSLHSTTTPQCRSDAAKCGKHSSAAAGKPVEINWECTSIPAYPGHFGN